MNYYLKNPISHSICSRDANMFQSRNHILINHCLQYELIVLITMYCTMR